MRFKVITGVSVLSLVLIVIINFTELRINVPFYYNIDVVRLNGLLNDFCLAVFSSYIFYFIVVYSKEYSDRKRACPFIAERIGYLCLCFEQFIDEVKAQVDQEDNVPYSNQESIINLCKNVNPNAYTKRKSLISELLVNRIRIIDAKINDVLVLSQYLDSDIYIILISIKENSFHRGNVNGHIEYTKHENLKMWSNDIERYAKLFAKLESTSALTLNRYIKEDILKMDK